MNEMNTVHRIMRRLSELSSEPPSDDTLTVHHDTLQRILFDELGEGDVSAPQAQTPTVELKKHPEYREAEQAASAREMSLSAVRKDPLGAQKRIERQRQSIAWLLLKLDIQAARQSTPAPSETPTVEQARQAVIEWASDVARSARLLESTIPSREKLSAAIDQLITAVRSASPVPLEQENEDGAGLIHQVASPLAETEPRLNEEDRRNAPDVPKRVTLEQLDEYADHFAQRAEDFDSEMSRVPKHKRSHMRFLRDAHFAAAWLLRGDLPMLDTESKTWVAKKTVLSAGRTRHEAEAALRSALMMLGHAPQVVGEQTKTGWQKLETKFSELISTELDHYAQKIAKRVLRKALGDKIAERSSADNT